MILLNYPLTQEAINISSEGQDTPPIYGALQINDAYTPTYWNSIDLSDAIILGDPSDKPISDRALESGAGDDSFINVIIY